MRHRQLCTECRVRDGYVPSSDTCMTFIYTYGTYPNCVGFYELKILHARAVSASKKSYRLLVKTMWLSKSQRSH